MSDQTQAATLPTDLAPAWSTASRSILIASFGNILEWYDFTIYGFVAVYLARNFFPSSNETAALLATFGVFAVGFFARPLGAILLGRLADIRGRRFVLLLAMFLMAGSSILIGVMPPVASIGVIAPALVILARLTQGLSAGAEFGGAAAFLIEWAPENRRGFITSFHQVGTYGGLLLGVAFIAVISTVLTGDQMASWGWRIPFLAGGVLAVYALYMRRSIQETPRFIQVEQSATATPAAHTTSTLVASLQSFGIVALWTVTAFAIMVYLTTYTQRLGGLTATEALWSTCIADAVAVILIPVFGAMSDRFGRRLVYGIGTVAFIILPVPIYTIIVGKPGFMVIMPLQVVLAVFTAMAAGVGPAMISELFPTTNRGTWVGISSALSVTLFGGFAPFISTLLVQRTGSPVSPAYYVAAIAILSLFTVFTMREHAHRQLS
jgi:MFS transporter, MHS family, proline/betaine transporter